MRKRVRMYNGVQPPTTVYLNKVYDFKGTYADHCNKDQLVLCEPTEAFVSQQGGLPLSSSYSCIFDEQPKMKRIGNCVHVRQSLNRAETYLNIQGSKTDSWKAESEPTTCGFYDFSATDGSWSINSTIQGITLNTTPDFGLGEASAQIPWKVWGACEFRKELQQQAIISMLPKFGNGLNLTVFLLEWMDTRRMLLQALMHLKSAIVMLPTMLRALWNRTGDLTVKDLLKMGSDSWLQQVFGVIPLVSDVVKAIENVYTFRRTVEKFLRMAGKRRTLYWSANIPADVLYGAVGKSLPDGQLEWTRVLGTGLLQPLSCARNLFHSVQVKGVTGTKIKRCRYTATCDFKYNVGYIGCWPKIMYALEHFGVKLSLPDVWEKIPFSFVIDWFYNVGKLLEPLKVENVPVDVVIFDFCDSLNFHTEAEGTISEVKIIPKEGQFWFPEMDKWSHHTGDSARTTKSSERCYYRLRAAPSPKSEWLDQHGRWVMPKSTWHIVTSAALLYQRWA